MSISDDLMNIVRAGHETFLAGMRAADDQSINAARLRGLLRDIGDILDTHAAGLATTQSMADDLRDAVERAKR